MEEDTAPMSELLSMPEPSIRDLRDAITQSVDRAGVLLAMLSELAQHRARQRLRADPLPEVNTDDLPPDGATGLFLDRPFDVEDLEWIKMAWDALLRNDAPNKRPTQLMLVFLTIRKDDRATAEFLRVMNTILLPLLRRLRLKSQPETAKVGFAHE